MALPSCRVAFVQGTGICAVAEFACVVHSIAEVWLIADFAFFASGVVSAIHADPSDRVTSVGSSVALTWHASPAIIRNIFWCSIEILYASFAVVSLMTYCAVDASMGAVRVQGASRGENIDCPVYYASRTHARLTIIRCACCRCANVSVHAEFAVSSHGVMSAVADTGIRIAGDSTATMIVARTRHAICEGSRVGELPGVARCTLLAIWSRVALITNTQFNVVKSWEKVAVPLFAVVHNGTVQINHTAGCIVVLC